MMKKCKKGLLLLLAVAMVFSLIACGTGDPGSSGKTETTEPKEPENPSKVFRNTAIQADDPVAQPCEQAGTIEKVEYDTRAYAVENYYEEQGEENVEIHIQKTMYVYTPYGYDASQQYNVLFLMHGGGENEGYWFGLGEKYQGEDAKDPMIQYAPAGNITKNVIDNLIQDGTTDPLIVIGITYDSPVDSEEYPPPTEDGFGAAPFYFEHFWKEFRYDIMPFVQENFATYAESATDEGFQAARDHFGFIGFSMGSRCTYQTIWNHNFDYVANMGNLSEGTGSDELLAEILDKLRTEYADYDVGFYYAACGEWDSLIKTTKAAYEGITTGLPSNFLIGDDVAAGNNAYFVKHVQGGHEYRCWVTDLYNVLQVFFK